MMVVKFKWFDKVEWKYIRCSIMANSVAEAEIYLRKEGNVDAEPYTNENKDSLTLIGVEPVSIPCFILEPENEK